MLPEKSAAGWKVQMFRVEKATGCGENATRRPTVFRSGCYKNDISPPLRSPSGGVRVRACGGALRGGRTAVRRTRSRAERLTAWTSEVPSFLPATTGRLERERGGGGGGGGGGVCCTVAPSICRAERVRQSKGLCFKE